MDPSSDHAAADTNDTSLPVPTRRGNKVFRAIVRFVLPIAFIALIIGACSGLVPPWPVVITLFFGLITTVSFIAAEKPAIGATSAVLAILVSGWLLRPIVDIRAATAKDRTYDRYFGIDSYDETVRRNIAVATGSFTLDTWVSASLYHVKSGQVREINAFTVGRSRNQIGARHWVDMRITLALGDRQSQEGRITQLGSAGHSSGGGRGGELVNDVGPVAAKFLPGRFTSGTRRIVYVEGDSGFTVDATMTVERFAQENKGNYLVVEVELH